MKPLHGLLVIPLALAGFVLGDARPSPDESPLVQLRRDLPLIEILVDEGLNIAAEDDPLRRAKYCNRLAERFAEEMQKAGREKNSPRLAELGAHLQALLTRGVAGNLSLAKKQLPLDSPRAHEVQQVGDQVLKATKPVENQLEKIPPAEDPIMLNVLQGLQKGRTDVENAVKGKGKGRKKQHDDGQKNQHPKGKKNKK